MRNRRRGAFTLVELLVVVAIISVLAALLMPALMEALTMARTAECMSQNKQIGLVMPLYADDYNGKHKGVAQAAPRSCTVRFDFGRHRGLWSACGERLRCSPQPKDWSWAGTQPATGVSRDPRFLAEPLVATLTAWALRFVAWSNRAGTDRNK